MKKSVETKDQRRKETMNKIDNFREQMKKMKFSLSKLLKESKTDQK